MKRLSFVCALLIGGLLIAGANGCSGNPNVEGAKLDLRNQDYARALENVNTALENEPDNAEALELKGRILQEMATEAETTEERSRIVSEMVETYNRAAEVDAEFAPIIEQRLRLAWVNEFQEGIEAFNRGEADDSAYLEAAQHFENATVIAPDSLGGYVNRSYALINAGREQEAIEPLEVAIERGETSPETYIRVSSLYSATGQPNESIRVLQEAREANPGDPDVQSQLLNAYIAADRVDDAMADYASLVEAEPGNRYYRYNYGSLLLEAEQYEEAIEHLREATRIDPSYGAAHFNLGAAWVNRAVDVRERINELDDELRAERANLSREEIQRREQEIEDLVAEQRNYFAEAVEPLERALDLSSGARFEVTGDPGVRFSATLSGEAVRDGSDISRSSEGFVPSELYVGEGTVSGTFERLSEEGELTVNLMVGDDQIASETTTEEDGTITINENVGEVGFQGASAESICQALASAYVQTNQQDRAEAVFECAGYTDEMQ